MSTAELTLTAELRTVTGKRVQQLRRTGLLPAVIYGPALEGTRTIQIDEAAFLATYRQAGTSRLLRLRLLPAGEQWRVFIKDVQYNLLKRRIDHADFYAANLREETTMAVPLVLIGTAPIVRRNEAVLSQLHQTVNVRALPDAIPARLELDVEQIESLNDDRRVSDLTPPPGVTIVDPPDTVLVAVSRTTVEEVEPPAAEAPAAEGTPAAE